MAGGIDWFRWHHGSVTDPKFGLIAKKAGARLGDVLAVWAFVLESASANEDRGTVGAVDAESLEFLLGLDDGAVYRILDAMTQRGLLGAGGVVVSWEKRQPKRERDDSSAERTRVYRERKASAVVCDDAQSHVTPCDASGDQKEPREEKSREEKKESAPALSARGAVGKALKAGGIDPTTINLDDPRLTALVEQGATPGEFEGLAREAVAAKKRNPVAWVLAVLPQRRADAAALTLAKAADAVSAGAAMVELAAQERRRQAEQAQAAVPMPAELRRKLGKSTEAA